MILFEEHTMTLLRKASSEREPMPTEEMPKHMIFLPVVPSDTYLRYPSYRLQMHIFVPLLIFMIIAASLVFTGEDSMLGVFTFLSAVALTAAVIILCLRAMSTRVTVTYESVTIRRGSETHVIPADNIDKADIEDAEAGKDLSVYYPEEHQRGRIYYHLRKRKSLLLHVWNAAPVRIATKRPDELVNAVRKAMDAAEENDE
ncbi:MAG: hypothetical protein FWH44_03055 [Methanomassiliicoccaceae archaeon]|nr:hypothetical protein [Methanomassiliicoccaceae archaeon]